MRVLSQIFLYLVTFGIVLASPVYTQTPTPVISGTFLEISDLEGLSIQNPRSGTDYGAIFLFGNVSGSVSSWGLIYDNENTLYDMYTGWGQVKLRSITLGEYSTQAGDSILLTYDGGKKKRVYLPELSGYQELYVGFDGSTYFDQWLRQTAQEALPSSPTPSATPSTTPTPEGYETPSPTSTPTITPVGYETPSPISTPTPTPYCYCCPYFSGDAIILSEQTSAVNSGWRFYYDYPCLDLSNMSWWTTSTYADWVTFLPEQGPGWKNYQIFVALGDTSSLPPGSHQAVIRLYDGYCHYPNTVYVNYTKPAPSPTVTNPPAPTPSPTLSPKPSPTTTVCSVCPVDIEGHVRDAVTSEPIEGATVEYRHIIFYESEKTDSTGYYRIYASHCEDLSIPIEIYCSAEGYLSESVWKRLFCWNVHNIDYYLVTESSVSFSNCASGDYDGDGTADVAVFRPAPGLWAIKGISRFYYGRAGDRPVSGDFNGDGTAAAGIFRPNDSLWAIRGLTRFIFGEMDDQAAPADYNGDGTAEAALFRERLSLWIARGMTRAYFGRAGDIPVPGDYRGDSTAEIGIFRPPVGLWAIRGLTRLYFGRTGDWPLCRDYTGDGTADYGIFRPQSGLWVVRNRSRSYYGRPGDYPVPANYTGDGTAGMGIFRGGSGLWAIKGLTRTYFGSGSDVPVTR